jgi:hypothetical protein
LASQEDMPLGAMATGLTGLGDAAGHGLAQGECRGVEGAHVQDP